MKSVIKSLFLSLIAIPMFCTAQETSSLFTYKIGDYTINLLAESQQKGNKSILIGATEAMLKEYAPDGTFPNAMNAFLIKTPDKNILFDTGLGKNIFNNLEALGVTPEQIDIVVLTHMHGDHIGGMLREGKKSFPNAEVYLPQPEHDYWTNQKTIEELPENRRGSFLNAVKVVDTYKDKLHLFEPDQLYGKENQIIKGIRGIAAYGHTPGHTVFLVELANEKLLIWGDVTHAMALQMPYPEVAVTYDVNPGDAIHTRKELLKYVEEKQIPIAGMHIAYPGMGKIVKGDTSGYKFIPFQ